jgi:hypothetical protein
VDNNYLDLGMNKSGFVHTLPVAALIPLQHYLTQKSPLQYSLTQRGPQTSFHLLPLIVSVCPSESVSFQNTRTHMLQY